MFDPWSGKIPHGKGQLSLWATGTEPTSPRASALKLESRPPCCNKRKPAHNNEDPAQPHTRKKERKKENVLGIFRSRKKSKSGEQK